MSDFYARFREVNAWYETKAKVYADCPQGSRAEHIDKDLIHGITEARRVVCMPLADLQTFTGEAVMP